MDKSDVKIFAFVLCAIIAFLCWTLVLSGDANKGNGLYWVGAIVGTAACVYGLYRAFTTNGVNKNKL